jgi:F-type H+-transporting ATPase subunit c
MKKFASILLVATAAFVLAPAAFAQAGEPAAAPTNWVAISASFGMALAAAGCGIAQSRVASAACEGMARNPGAAEPIRAAMFLGLVFIETLVLFTLVMVALKAK